MLVHIFPIAAQFGPACRPKSPALGEFFPKGCPVVISIGTQTTMMPDSGLLISKGKDYHQWERTTVVPNCPAHSGHTRHRDFKHSAG